MTYEIPSHIDPILTGTYHPIRAKIHRSGPWDNEPDLLAWRDKASGLMCRIVRAPGGHLCGYVAVTKAHSWFGAGYSDGAIEPWRHVECHGGLTFSGQILGPNAWFFGFDCSHSGDVAPAYGWSFGQTSQYRTLAYVVSQVESLALQIAGVTA